MATADQIKALIKSYLADDDKERFRTISLQVAAYEASKGHKSLAIEIKDIVDNAKLKENKVIQFTPDLSDLVLLTKPKAYLNNLVISKTLTGKINRILKEYLHKGKLEKHGLLNRRKLLMAGKPGTGKTMTASVIASELNLPLYTVQMDRLINKYMGETGAKLRQIFDVIKKQKGVFLFDEFDAIGAERTNENEVGEMRRVLNLFLQFIENDNSESLILAATNNIDILDKALFRRFDDVLHYQLPDDSQILHLLEDRFAGFKLSFQLGNVLDCAYGLSHSDITQACLDAIKEYILEDKKSITMTSFCHFLDDRKMAYGESNAN